MIFASFDCFCFFSCVHSTALPPAAMRCMLVGDYLRTFVRAALQCVAGMSSER
jgi:hypothetical protein